MSDDYDDAADRELAMWPGVTIERTITSGGHRRLLLTYRGGSRVVIYSQSGSDTYGPANHVGDVRRELRMLGAKRNKPASKAPTERRNKAPPRAPKIAAPVAQPRDPWAALRGGQ